MDKEYTERTGKSLPRPMYRFIEELKKKTIVGSLDFSAYSIEEPPVAVVKELISEESDVYTVIGDPRHVNEFNRLFEIRRERFKGRNS